MLIYFVYIPSGLATVASILFGYIRELAFAIGWDIYSYENV